MFKIELHLLFLWSVCLLRTSALSDKYESLTHIYQTYNEGPGLRHYYNYGPLYDENINHLREKAVRLGEKVKMLEIGVQSGGSTRVWKRYFRGTLAYVGLDINSRCKQFESLDEGIRIVIGSQLNTSQLLEVCTRYGRFDLVVDDGGHTNKMITTSLLILWNCLNDNAVYVIEDLMLSVVGLPEDEENIFQRVGRWMKIRSPRVKELPTLPANVTNHKGWHLKKLVFFNSMLFLHYGKQVPELQNFYKGSHWVPRLWEKKKEVNLSKLNSARVAVWDAMTTKIYELFTYCNKIFQFFSNKYLEVRHTPAQETNSTVTVNRELL